MTPDVTYAGSGNINDAAFSAAGTKPINALEAIIKADDLAYILFCKSDLKEQKQFLNDFGMTLAAETEHTIYMRGSGPLPFFYAAYHPGCIEERKHKKNGYAGIGFSVNNESDIIKISQATQTPIKPIDGPGGGKRVRLHDPDGFIVDIVWGRQPVERLVTRSTLPEVNTQFEKKRINTPVRTPIQPSELERLGHCVLSVTDFESSMNWYMQHTGIVPTDVLCLEDGTPALSFNRLDRGSQPADHHAFVLIQDVEAQYRHSAYETIDIDSIGQGQQFLKWKGWKHFWGMGRHTLGSQIFDYWLDPEGDELEHYADGDVFDNTFVTRYHPLDIGGTWAWGDDAPKSMRSGPGLKQIWKAIQAMRNGKISKATLAMIKKALSVPARPWLS